MTKTNPAVLAALFAPAILAQTDCSYYQGLGCTSGSVTTNPADWVDRSFQTPLPGTANWKEGYQGMGRIVCYNNIIYSSDRQSASVEARCRQHSSIVDVQYNWNNEGFTSNKSYSVGTSFAAALTLVVKAVDQSGAEFTITPEAPNFLW